MSKTYFVTNQKSALWRSMWHSLAMLLSGASNLPQNNLVKLTDQEITIFVKDWSYEGTDERGHCFTSRQESGRKNYLFIEVQSTL